MTFMENKINSTIITFSIIPNIFLTPMTKRNYGRQKCSNEKKTRKTHTKINCQ